MRCKNEWPASISSRSLSEGSVQSLVGRPINRNYQISTEYRLCINLDCPSRWAQRLAMDLCAFTHSVVLNYNDTLIDH